MTIASDDGWLRVRLPDAPPVNRVSRSSIGEIVGPDFVAGDDVTLLSPVSIARRGQAWEIVDAGGFRPDFDGLLTVEFAQAEGMTRPLSLDGVKYPGALRIVAIKPDDDDEDATGRESDFDVVNHVLLEMYLPGVVARELFSHWHAEAFAAQAIAARSFAASEIDFFSTRRHYDLSNTQSSQVYSGVTASKKAHRAVVETRGAILAWDGALVPGYYSSCCGGVAANAVDAIGPHPANDIPPLRSRSSPNACTGAPVYAWRVERPVDELTRRINAFGRAKRNRRLRSIGLLRSIEVAQRNEHGRPTAMRIVADGDQAVELSADRFRDVVNFGAGGMDAARALRSSFITAAVDRGTAVFSGNGFGHGVGLCQYGAQSLARDGVRSAEMLAMFYPEAKIAPAYG